MSLSHPVVHQTLQHHGYDLEYVPFDFRELRLSFSFLVRDYNFFKSTIVSELNLECVLM